MTAASIFFDLNFPEPVTPRSAFDRTREHKVPDHNFSIKALLIKMALPV